MNRDISDYTEAQAYFMIAVDEKTHSDAVLPVKSDLTIEGESDNPEEVKEKFADWRKVK